jgi:phosphatidylserine/phosphatidylglycerophosphate/cardiolipin synthase-like enzyme
MADWFTTTGTLPGDGTFTPLIDGEAAWSAVGAAIAGAEQTIHMNFWMMHLDHELDRPSSLTFKDPAARQSRTLDSILLNKSDDGIKVRIILWVPPTIPSTEKELLRLLLPMAPASILLMLDLRLVRYAIAGEIELLLEPHPGRGGIGSWHQKTIVLDDNIAFVGGMNAKQNDWDASHDVYDYRRTPHNTTGHQRLDMSGKLEKTEYAPRHDFMVRIEGPLVQDVQNNFIQRWNQAIADQRFFSRNLVPIPKSQLPVSSGAKKGQIVRTMPKYSATPMGERGCWEIYESAITNAQKYIYIEDQYFRSGELAEKLALACTRNRSLILIVVTMPDYLVDPDLVGIGWASPSTPWTAAAFNTLAAAIPGFCFFHLQASALDIKGKRIFVPFSTHAKLMIVDDQWYTIGSCNINVRGFEDEGELNIAVNEPAEALKLRQALWSEHLMAPCPGDIVAAAKLWYDHATRNFAAEQKKVAPVSRVFPFVQDGPLLPIVPKGWF